MNKTIRDVAKVLCDVPHSVSCKVCKACDKCKVQHNELSCVGCIEEGLQKLIARATPMKPVLYGMFDENDNDYVFDEDGNLIDSYVCCPNCKKQDIYDFEYSVRFKHCSNCGQAIDWSKEDVDTTN